MLDSIRKCLLAVLFFIIYLIIISGVFKISVFLFKIEKIDIFLDIFNLILVSFFFYFFSKEKVTNLSVSKSCFKKMLFITFFFIILNIIILLILNENNNLLEKISLYEKISMIFIKPITEELFFRGFLLAFLLKKIPLKNFKIIIFSVTIVNLCFIFLHQSWDLWINLKLFVFSSIASLLYILTKKVTYSIVFHIFINSLFVYFQIDKPFYFLNISFPILLVICVVVLLLILFNIRKIYIDNLY